MTVPDELLLSLAALGLRVPDGTNIEPLEGGVSSEILRIDLPDGPVCVKRALEKLRVQADWHAPVARNAFEVAWYERARRAVPSAVPPVRAHDPQAGLFVMEYLPPDRYPLWKHLLRDGQVEPDHAHAVGETLARIHAHCAGDAVTERRFASDAIFLAIRLQPYLAASAARHPSHAGALNALITTTRGARRTLIHGDVSPKNILIGEAGPVLLDAECACWGDPAFDLAFCLNHLLLKCLWVPGSRGELLASFDALWLAYADRVDWEPPGEVERRTARLLPGLLLARIDGKSPVEYLDARAQDLVRRFALQWLARPPQRLAELRAAWAQASEPPP